MKRVEASVRITLRWPAPGQEPASLTAGDRSPPAVVAAHQTQLPILVLSHAHKLFALAAIGLEVGRPIQAFVTCSAGPDGSRRGAGDERQAKATKDKSRYPEGAHGSTS